MYESRISVLRSVHADCSPVEDWARLLAIPEPQQPSISLVAAQAARAALDGYTPGFFERAFGGAKTRRMELENAVVNEETYANSQHAALMREWEQAVTALRWKQRVGAAVIGGDVDAYHTVIAHWDLFGEIEELGSTVEIAQLLPREAEIDLYVNDDEVIPTEILSLLQSGKMSQKKMPVNQRNLLYQDYVCGSALRIGRELFAKLPIQRVLVHAVADLLDSATGNLEAQPILSVAMPRETFARLNFDSLDASDSMKNFTMRMNFTKGGFLPIEPIERAQLPPV